MIASTVTIVDDVYGVIRTKNDKDVQEFLHDFAFVQGDIEPVEGGYEADLFTVSDENLTTILGRIFVTF